MTNPALYHPASLAQTVRVSRVLFERFIKGFDDSNRTTQAMDMPNHAAWSMGHMALTLHRGAERLIDGPLPETDFIEGSDQGDAERFGTESVCYGSVPTDDPDRYPSWARCGQIFGNAVERLATTVEASTPEALAELTQWGVGGGGIPKGDLVSRLAFHHGTHAGQLIDLRRALKMGSAFS
ncbi:MAG: DinB family protein [Planctomycetota bacterium]